jgi:hypothetical protein
MKDFIGQELEVGNWVVFITPDYRDLTLGEITKFTPKNMHVTYIHHDRGRHWSKLIRSNTSVKIDGPELTAMLLKRNKG